MPASRKTRGRPDAGSRPGPVSAPVSAPNSAPVEESPKDEAPVESRLHTEGKRAKVAAARRRRQHGTAYRWIVAYLPIMALLFALLGAVWIYTGFINPPPPTPAQQWTKIENKWSPVREKDRAAIAADTLDFVKQQAAYTDFNTQTKGWLDAVTAVKDWGVGASSVSSFLDDGKQYLLVLQQVEAAKTPYDVIALTTTLTQWDTQFTTDVAQIETDLSLPATSPVPSGLALPSVNPTPTPTPGPSGSAAPSGSPGASPSPGVSPVPSPGTVASPTSSPS